MFEMYLRHLMKPQWYKHIVNKYPPNANNVNHVLNSSSLIIENWYLLYRSLRQLMQMSLQQPMKSERKGGYNPLRSGGAMA